MVFENGYMQVSVSQEEEGSSDGAKVCQIVCCPEADIEAIDRSSRAETGSWRQITNQKRLQGAARGHAQSI